MYFILMSFASLKITPSLPFVLSVPYRRRYNKPILTVLGSAKKQMTAIGTAYGECVKKNRTDNFLYVPLIPDNNPTDLRLELQVNKIISDAAETRIQPSLTPRTLEQVQNDRSFANCEVDTHN